MACVLPNMEFRILKINTNVRGTSHSQVASKNRHNCIYVQTGPGYQKTFKKKPR